MRLAAIDIGTNTVRLIVVDAEGSGLTDVERSRAITRLGQGVDVDRKLDPEAIERTVTAIEAFVQRATELGAERIRVAGTSALRDATDRDAFASLVKDRTGQRLEVLSGPDEGKLSLRGATANLPIGPRYVVCDIGGGSTELSTSYATVSLDIGSVRLKERFLAGDPPTSDEVNQARRFVDSGLDRAGELMLTGSEKLVGVAGTITTLGALVAGLDDYDMSVVHGMVIPRSAVFDWTKRLLSMTTADIVALGAVEPGRADVLAGGVLILKRVMNRFLFDEVLVSEQDILDGLALDLATDL
jgi:exopolyphosphatase / guanosine-5'-triphosphate,3'-diphosphate pyrophosphatase